MQTEDEVLKKIQRALGGAGAELPQAGAREAIGDDAAVWRPRAGHEAVLTCDWFLQGTHFLIEQHPADAAGWKCLARAVSDLAAVGAEPRCFLLSLALPKERSGGWLDDFLKGLRAASRKLECPAAGGDTTRRDQVLINVTVVGECRRGQAVLRSGARPGDEVFVSGRLGEAEYGLHLLTERRKAFDKRDARLRKHLYPEPRLALGAWLAQKRIVSAMMDVSDGLSTDLRRLCIASGVGARIEEERVPCVRIGRDAGEGERLSLALHGGDDYELLFTVAPKNVARLASWSGKVRVTRIGKIANGRKIVLASRPGGERELLPEGWDPFRE